MTLHLDHNLEQRLEHLAESVHRTPDELAQKALSSYLDHIEALTADLREAEESAEREGWLTTEEVFARLEKQLHEPA